MFVLNLTQHLASETQKKAGVVDLPAAERTALQQLLTFEEPPTLQEMEARAASVVQLALDFLGEEEGDLFDADKGATMIGGAPYFMGTLESALGYRGLNPRYSFSRREVEEKTLPDGTVKKVSVFTHVGWV